MHASLAGFTASFAPAAAAADWACLDEPGQQHDFANTGDFALNLSAWHAR